jgi:hypothetical protein
VRALPVQARGEHDTPGCGGEWRFELALRHGCDGDGRTLGDGLGEGGSHPRDGCRLDGCLCLLLLLQLLLLQLLLLLLRDRRLVRARTRQAHSPLPAAPV